MTKERLASAIAKADISDGDRRVANVMMREMRLNNIKIVRRREEINSSMALLNSAPDGVALTDKARGGLRNEIRKNGSEIAKFLEENIRSREELKHLARTGEFPKRADEVLMH